MNAQNCYGWTAFMFACMQGRTDVVKLLLEYSNKIDLNAKDKRGMTPFMIACFEQCKSVVKLLLEYSKVVDTRIPENFDTSEEIKKMSEKIILEEIEWK